MIHPLMRGSRTQQQRRIFRRQMALPSDHGTWVFLLSPLAIGLAAGERLSTVSSYLVVAVLAGLLVRHPVTTLVKIWAGRRSRADLPAAIFWSVLYGGIGLVMAIGLAMRGFGYLLYAAIPGMLIFCWYLVLVGRRAERGRTGLEILGAGVLALSAAAGLWIGRGQYLPLGWLLWIMIWAQSAASIHFVHMRLDHRRWGRIEAFGILGKRWPLAVVASSLNLAAMAALGPASGISTWIFIAYLPQWLESLWFARHPTDDPPVTVGVRQLVISTLYTVLFISLW